MRILKYLLILIAIAGAILTMPTLEALRHPGGLVFAAIFVGFLGLLWFALRMGKTKKVPGAAESTQVAPLQAE